MPYQAGYVEIGFFNLDKSNAVIDHRMKHDRIGGHASSAIYGNNDTPAIMSYTFQQQDETINADWRLVPNWRHLARYGGGIAHEQL